MKMWTKLSILSGIVITVVLALQWFNGWKRQSYSLSSGKEGGGYHAFSEALSELSRDEKLPLEIRAIESEGSKQNIDRVSNNEADFGLVQLSSERSEGVRAVATVYKDIVHLLVHKDSKIKGLTDLEGKRVSISLPSSGTNELSKKLLNHYGIEKVETVELSSTESVNLLKLEKLDAMILVTAMRAPIVLKALETGVIEHALLSEGGGVAAGIASRYPYLEIGEIPKHAFSKDGAMGSALPARNIEVLQVPTQLVCREGLSKKAVFEMTRSLYLNKRLLEGKVQAVHGMSENDIHAGYPLHEGAEAYYLRKAPGFLVVYAEVIALLLSCLIAIVGIGSAVKKAVKLRLKNRIDVYYRELNAILKMLEERKGDDLDKIEEQLHAIKHKAFDELVDERLTADESFRIFQDLLEQCSAELARVKG